jgi:hypothetical protein
MFDVAQSMRSWAVLAVEWWWIYVYYAHRKGAKFWYVSGTVQDYCTEHDCWEGGIPSQVDYGKAEYGITKYVNGQGVEHDEDQPCNVQAAALTQKDRPATPTPGAGPKWEPGSRFYHL